MSFLLSSRPPVWTATLQTHGQLDRLPVIFSNWLKRYYRFSGWAPFHMSWKLRGILPRINLSKKAHCRCRYTGMQLTHPTQHSCPSKIMTSWKLPKWDSVPYTAYVTWRFIVNSTTEIIHILQLIRAKDLHPYKTAEIYFALWSQA